MARLEPTGNEVQLWQTCCVDAQTARACIANDLVEPKEKNSVQAKQTQARHTDDIHISACVRVRCA